MKKRNIIWVNVFVIVVLLSILIYPLKPGIDLKEREVRFRWYGLYRDYTLYVDDNDKFSSPIVVNTKIKDYPIELEPGVYFWKVKSRWMSSPVKELVFDSDVSIKVENGNLENDGNVDLNVSLEKSMGAIVVELPYKDRVKLEEEKYNITAKQK